MYPFIVALLIGKTQLLRPKDKNEFVDSIYTHWVFTGNSSKESLRQARNWQSRKDQPFLIFQSPSGLKTEDIDPVLRDPVSDLPESLWVSLDYFNEIEIVRLVNLSDEEWIRNLNVFWVLEFLGFQEVSGAQRMTMTANQKWSEYRSKRKNWLGTSQSNGTEADLESVDLYPMQVLTISLPAQRAQE